MFLVRLDRARYATRAMLLAESYLHQLSPEIIQFTESLALRWYGVSYIFGFLLAWLFMRRMSKAGRSPIVADQVGDLIFSIVIGVLLGGRIGYALFYQPSLFVSFTSHLPFWDLLAIHNGGMASHGGMIGFIVATVWWGRRHQLSTLNLLDMGSMMASIALCAGRLANFVNGELKGKVLPNQINPPWWSVKYPDDLATADFPRLTEVHQALGQPAGEMLSIERIIALLKDGHTATVEAVQPLLTAYYPSQIIQAITDGPVLFTLLLIVWCRPRRPGVLGAWFLIGYGALRIVSEVFREPDIGVALLVGLSRGQLLSIVMMLAGFVSLIVVSRRKVDRMPGMIGPFEPVTPPSSPRTRGPITAE